MKYSLYWKASQLLRPVEAVFWGGLEVARSITVEVLMLILPIAGAHEAQGSHTSLCHQFAVCPPDAWLLPRPATGRKYFRCDQRLWLGKSMTNSCSKSSFLKRPGSWLGSPRSSKRQARTQLEISRNAAERQSADADKAEAEAGKTEA
jgi:hypothetical protein